MCAYQKAKRTSRTGPSPNTVDSAASEDSARFSSKDILKLQAGCWFAFRTPGLDDHAHVMAYGMVYYLNKKKHLHSIQNTASRAQEQFCQLFRFGIPSASSLPVVKGAREEQVQDEETPCKWSMHRILKGGCILAVMNLMAELPLRAGDGNWFKNVIVD